MSFSLMPVAMNCSQSSAPDEKVKPEQLPSFELGFADYHQALSLLMDDSHFQLQVQHKLLCSEYYL